jgi:hypothetical protein
MNPLGPGEFVATVAGNYVDSAPSLESLIEILAVVWEAGLGEDLCLWQGLRLLQVWTSEGKRYTMLQPRQAHESLDIPARI